MPMRVRMFSFSMLSLFLLFFGQVYADPAGKDHGHKTPHGGMIQEAEGMHAELLIDKVGQPKVYLFDKAMKPLDRADIQSKLTVKGHGGVQHSRELKAVKDPKEGVVYKGEPINEMTDWDTAVVSLKIKDRWTHIRFSHH
jgi:hypothetical protein